MDTIVFAQAPKLTPYRENIRETLAKAVAIQSDFVNVKATTTEGLGHIGQGEGIAAMCSALIEKI